MALVVPRDISAAFGLSRIFRFQWSIKKRPFVIPSIVELRRTPCSIFAASSSVLSRRRLAAASRYESRFPGTVSVSFECALLPG